VGTGTILMTGFAPFGGLKKNPSWETVRTLKCNGFADNVHKLCLPVDFQTPHRLLLQEIQRIKPDYVFCSGVHFASAFHLETLGHDVGRHNMQRKATVPLASSSDFLKRAVEWLNLIYHTRVSQNAQGYVCEHITYWLARFAKRYGFQGGFIHVPTFETCPLKTQKKWWKNFLEITLGYFGPNT